jgi:transposase
MRKSPKFSPEVVERAVRMVFDAKDQYPSQWAAIESIACKIGCTGETLRKWVPQGERDSGSRSGPTTAQQQRIKELEREVRELLKTNEILKLASASFAQAAASVGGLLSTACAELVLSERRLLDYRFRFSSV